jgi:antirestriction protein ArdC
MDRISSEALLRKAVTEPGIISSAYSQFHNYSLGNMLLAAMQCSERGLPLGPIATYQRWKELGRHVKRGERAITLCRPITVRSKKEENDETEEKPLMRFIFRPNWFVLAQTEGQDLPEPEIAGWDEAQALAALGITEIPFASSNGNVMGYAKGREIAISPVNPMPHKTRFHETAHVLLGHTVEGDHDDTEMTPQTLREAEAESVALLCCAALSLPGADESRGYIQHWYGTGNQIPERSAQRILRVADQILRAGRIEEQVAA